MHELTKTMALWGILAALPAQAATRSATPVVSEKPGQARATAGAATKVTRLDAASLAKVREAVGMASPAYAHGLIAEGTTKLLGLEHATTLVCMPDGRYLEDMRSKLPSSTGYDGKHGWKVDWTGMPCEVEGRSLWRAQMFAGVVSGCWLVPGFPVQILGGEVGDDGIRFELRNQGCVGVVLVDAATLLPSSFSWKSKSGESSIRLASYERTDGASIPRLVEGKVDGQQISIHLTGVRAGEATSGRLCAARTERPEDTEFAGELPSTLELKKAWTGHLFVRIHVDDGEECLFFLDSGAGSHCIDAGLAKRLGLEVLGEVPAMGVGGTVTSSVVRAKSLRVGPWTQKNPVMVTLDLKPIAKLLKVDAVGIVGYDFFARALVALDIQGAKVRIDRPGAWKERKAHWTPLSIRGSHPCIECRFEGDRKGLFRLDTGANGTVSFHGGYVARHKLLEGRATKPGKSGGVGGNIVVHDGRLEWFQIGPARFKKPMVRFAQSKSGVLGGDELAGNIGVGFLKPFVLLFDYPNRRLGFEKR